MIGAQAENALKNDDVLLNLNKMILIFWSSQSKRREHVWSTMNH